MRFKLSPHHFILGLTGFCTVSVSVYLVQKAFADKKRHDEMLRKLPGLPLVNKNGFGVDINPVGASIQRMFVADKNGDLSDVVLGYDRGRQYKEVEPTFYYGAIVGRCANRIANAKFKVGEEEYVLKANNGPNALHGGPQGLHRRVWDVRRRYGQGFEGLEFKYRSPDGEEGYPGNLDVHVLYVIPHYKDEVTVTITATTDKPTPVNIVQHSYFNLGGHDSGSILDHEILINADHYTPVDANLIPTGVIAPVAGTPFDLRALAPIKQNFAKVRGGFDHNFVLFGLGGDAKNQVKNGTLPGKPRLAAVVHDPKSGRMMEVLTNAPGLQFYSGNFLDGAPGKKGVAYHKHSGLCLETQAFPDSINQPNFPSVVLQPGELYQHEIIYRFSTKP